MATDVIMPVLGMAQDSGTLVRWRKQPRQSVTRGEILFEVETDKAVQEIEAPVDGVLGPWLADEGEVVPVTQVVARLYAPGEAPVSGEEPAPQAKMASTTPASAPVAVSPLAARVAAAHNVDLTLVKPDGGRVQKADVLAYMAAEEQPPAGKILASPKARRLAGVRNLPLTAIQGSGPEGAVLAADVLAWQPPAAAEQPAPGMPTVALGPAPALEDQPAIPMSTVWRLMAERTTQAWTTTPHFFLQRRALAGRLQEWLRGAQSRLAQKVTASDILVMACARALALHPQVNASWQDGCLIAAPRIHIGLAVALEDGLVAPVIRDADRLSLSEIARTRADLVARAQAGQLRIADLEGGTFTVSNLGMFGVERFLAILNPPQAAILAVGAIHDEVLAVEGRPAIQSVVELTVTFDHRVVDGARGARFLQTLVGLIEEPLRLLEQPGVTQE